MHSFVTSKNAQWPRLIWPTLYIRSATFTIRILRITAAATSTKTASKSRT